MKLGSAAEVAARIRPDDSLALGLGPGQTPALLEALGERDDWKGLTVFAGLLLGNYALFRRPGVRLVSAFFGPIERLLREAGADVAFVPGDFRRMTLFLERLAPRVVTATVTPPDADGWMSLALHAGASIPELGRAARDPERLVVAEINPRLPRTRGIEPGLRHALHVDEVDLALEAERDPPVLPEAEPSEIERAIAGHVRPFVADGSTLQTGIGGIPGAVVGLLAEQEGGDYGIHSEMFTTGLMRLQRSGKVTNRRKGIFEGYSVTTFALGTPELYAWLDGRDDVRFLPVEWTNTPSMIARNRDMVSINGALMLDLAGQVVADTIEGRQYSGIGGHEDFVSGASSESDDRSLICLPSTAHADGRLVSRIVAGLPAGSVITTPRHQVDVVVTEHGAAEVSGRTVRDRARALAAVAHPDFRDELRAAADRLG